MRSEERERETVSNSCDTTLVQTNALHLCWMGHVFLIDYAYPSKWMHGFVCAWEKWDEKWKWTSVCFQFICFFFHQHCRRFRPLLSTYAYILTKRTCRLTDARWKMDKKNYSNSVKNKKVGIFCCKRYNKNRTRNVNVF